MLSALTQTEQRAEVRCYDFQVARCTYESWDIHPASKFLTLVGGKRPPHHDARIIPYLLVKLPHLEYAATRDESDFISKSTSQSNLSLVSSLELSVS